jgi:hypothetical protein
MIIWKFPIKITDWQLVEMPIGAMILDAKVQDGTICLWALCDENADKEIRYFMVFGTGEVIPSDSGKYIATVQMKGGGRIWHIFEQINR